MYIFTVALSKHIGSSMFQNLQIKPDNVEQPSNYQHRKKKKVNNDLNIWK